MDIIYYITAGWFCCILASSLVGWLRGHFVEGFTLGLVFGPYGVYASVREFERSRAESTIRRHIRGTWRRLTPIRLWVLILSIPSFCACLSPFGRDLLQGLPALGWMVPVGLLWVGFIPIQMTLIEFLNAEAQRSHPICPECDYNLTGNESGVCPECGQRMVVDSEEP